MCGIAGVMDRKQVTESRVDAMLDLIRHRGPDDSGVFTTGGGMR